MAKPSTQSHQFGPERPNEEMAEFLTSRGYWTPHRGEVLEGHVVRSGRDGIWVDIGGKSEGFVPFQEMRSLGPDPLHHLDIGDEVTVLVLRVEDDDGPIVLSVDRARGERGWRTAQRRFERGEVFSAPVVGYNNGGLLVDVEGVTAFLPVSHLAGPRIEGEDAGARVAELSQRVGQTVQVKIIELNRRRNRLIVSERLAAQEWRSQRKEQLLEELREGEIRRGRVSSISSFGVFVDLGGADGLVHISELSWDRNKSPEDVVQVGDIVDVYVLKVDPETKRIALSLRRAQPDIWTELVSQYQVGQLIKGTVTKLTSFGAFVRIDGGIEGLVHISELSDQKINHPREVVQEGEELMLKILRIEPERHRLGLSLKQAVLEAGVSKADSDEPTVVV